MAKHLVLKKSVGNRPAIYCDELTTRARAAHMNEPSVQLLTDSRFTDQHHLRIDLACPGQRPQQVAMRHALSHQTHPFRMVEDGDSGFRVGHPLRGHLKRLVAC